MASRRARSLIRRLIGLAVLALVALSAAYGYVVYFWAELPHAGLGTEVVVFVPRGAGPRRLAQLLATERVVSRAWLFEVFLRVRRASSRIRAGRFLLRDDLSPAQILERIARVGSGGALRVTIPEGRNIFQIAALLETEGIVSGQAFLTAARDPDLLRELHVAGETVEGYLFPDTYDLLPGARGHEVVRRLKVNFDRRVAPVFAAQAARVAALGASARLDERGVLVVASLVEAEAQRADERPRVAAVFLNRLSLPGFHPRYLNSDPSVAYGCRLSPAEGPSCARYSGEPGAITRSMLEDAANRYNTYRLAGLPPGPICNPGLEAIRSVLYPARSQDLYFMARGDGSHAFATNLPEHNANVQRYRAAH
jgi:UPF0755 protein